MGPAPDAASFMECFSELRDPRRGEVSHPLLSVLVLSLCAVIAGADGPTSIEEWGLEHEDFITNLVSLPHGIPSHDTIGRILSVLNPVELERLFAQWMQRVCGSLGEGVVAIDGKTLRRAREMADGVPFVHMVSAWSSACGVVLGQVKTVEKSNEIEAIPRLLELLSLKNAIVTIDAAGCQRKIVEKIQEAGADYVVAVKDNQPILLAAVADAFSKAETSRRRPQGSSFAETRDQGHGRTEVRRCWVMPTPEEFEPQGKWPSIASIVHIQSERIIKGKPSVSDRWYVSSIAGLNAARAAKFVRSHWQIENQLHWTLDVVFGEDQSRLRAENGAENFAVIRHVALNCLRGATTVRGGVKSRRRRAGWNTTVLAQILGLVGAPASA